REATTPELGAARGAIARLLPREGLGQPRREPPEFREPARDHATAIEHRPEPAADRAALEAPLHQGIKVIARGPSIPMRRVPARDKEPLEPGWDRSGHDSWRPHSRPWRTLRHGELREASPLGRLESHDDAVLRDTGLEQFGGDSVLQPVALDPQLAVDDVD